MKNKKIALLNVLLTFTLISCNYIVNPTESTQPSSPYFESPSITESTPYICDIHMDDDENDICDICGQILVEYDYSADGTYILDSISALGVDIKDSYYSNYLRLNEGDVEWYKTTISGTKVEKATYEKEDNKITIKVGILPYEFDYDVNNKTLSFSGTINKKKVNMKYTLVDNYIENEEKGDVSFQGELFGDDINENFYNYCPSVMIEGNDTMHIWYCSNEVSGNVTDYIAYRKGKLYPNGKWKFSNKELVLFPGKEGEFDSRHVCDPSVVKGDFNYNNKTYNYLMAYLGCLTSDCTCNEVGIAVAEKPEGPWVKVKEVNPICNYFNSPDFGQDGNQYWGYGQPSLVSVDKEGTILLFYTKGIRSGTYTYVEKWDLSNLNNPHKLNEAKLADGGAIGVFNNADFAYDPVGKKMFTIKEDHNNGWYPTDGGVNWISGSNSVYYTLMGNNDSQPGDSLFKNHAWALVSTIGKEATGFDRVHNAALVTDEYGWLMDYSSVPVVYTMSRLASEFPDWDKGGQWPALHTYRLHGYMISL